MNIDVAKPDDIELELLESQGGNISPDHFGELLDQLKKSRSLDHTSRPVLGTTLGELDIVYVVLHKDYPYEEDDNGIPKYTCVMKGEVDYWLAGFGCLRAQKMGYGRFLVRRLLQHAFDALHIHRITVSIACPVHPNYTAERKKHILFNTKQLCWILEKFGFVFEGVTRGVVQDSTAAGGEDRVWEDLHRMSILDTDYFEGGKLSILSNARAFQEENPKSTSPWESMIQRQEEEKRDLDSWTVTPKVNNAVDDAFYDEDDDSDDGTVIGGDDESDWEAPDEFES